MFPGDDEQSSDAAYHAVALVHGGVLLTADERYVARAARAGSVATLRQRRVRCRSDFLSSGSNPAASADTRHPGTGTQPGDPSCGMVTGTAHGLRGPQKGGCPDTARGTSPRTSGAHLGGAPLGRRLIVC